MSNKIILENPNGRRFQLVVDNDGNLGTKEVPAPCKPEYEVKYLVNPDLVLNDDGTYKEEFQNLFTDFALKGTTRMSYYDTEDLALNQAGWTIRIRKKSNKKAQHCTFKRRYSGTNKKNALTLMVVDKAVEKAYKDVAHNMNEQFNFGWEIDYGFS